ncbi:hypothetical protein [Brevibacillus sp. HB2.2]|uniref:hypothetical protein n=1 Tax=Brevibacillus sp. HB2.2 TaxID=2738846 RepID=UPI00156AAF27|nr:hypothetical protein [Brevibacillus sp. HB2.2]NRS46426.1 hypothetical protein [Brevibacillus sp. HB2.2]
MKKVMIALNASKDLYDYIVKVTTESHYLPILDDPTNVRSLVLSDRLLGDDTRELPQGRDAALLQIMKALRQLQIRVIFISLSHPPPKEGDGFLGEMVHLGIYDIWYQKTINQEKFVSHFLDENRLDYKDVDYLSNMSRGFSWTPLTPAATDPNLTD